jgi:mevalonate kinase
MGGVYKPSGAGSGDVGIAFTRSQEDLEKVSISIKEAGYSTLPVGIAPAEIRSAGKAFETVNSRTT